MDEQKLEQELRDKNLNAPRLTPQLIDATILAIQYHVFDGTVMTICCLTLQNGYNVVGTSAPASSDNFNEEIWRKLVFDDARRKIWALEGYLLKSKLKEQI